MSRVLEFHRNQAFDPASHEVFWVSGWVGSLPVLVPAGSVERDVWASWGSHPPAGAVSMMNRLEVPDGLA